MARPRRDDRRDAILEAAAHVIAEQGLAAPTSLIARRAGVATGSLFTYFPTKRDLLNQLFVDLKTEMASAALDGMPSAGSERSMLSHMWSGWMKWAVDNVDGRRALAQLSVSDEISDESRQVGRQLMAGVADLLDRSRADGVLRSAPLPLVAGLLNAAADATIEFIQLNPDQADGHRDMAFEAVWRMIS